MVLLIARRSAAGPTREPRRARRRYSYRELVDLKIVKGPLDAGVSLQAARRAIECLRCVLGEELGSANLMLNGLGSVVVQDDRELIDLIRRGQGVIGIVGLPGVKEELDWAMRDLPPPSAAAG